MVAIGRLIEIEWEAMVDQDRFRYNDENGRIMVFPEERLLVRRSASGAEVREGGRHEIRPMY